MRLPQLQLTYKRPPDSRFEFPNSREEIPASRCPLLRSSASATTADRTAGATGDGRRIRRPTTKTDGEGATTVDGREWERRPRGLRGDKQDRRWPASDLAPVGERRPAALDGGPTSPPTGGDPAEAGGSGCGCSEERAPTVPAQLGCAALGRNVRTSEMVLRIG